MESLYNNNKTKKFEKSKRNLPSVLLIMGLSLCIHMVYIVLLMFPITIITFFTK